MTYNVKDAILGGNIMSKCNFCENILINVNQIVLRKGYEQQYIKFSKRLDEYLRKTFGEYYICDQVNQNKTCHNIFYVEAFYRDIPGVYEAIEEIGDIISQLYENEFGDYADGSSITSFFTVNRVYPISYYNCKDN